MVVNFGAVVKHFVNEFRKALLYILNEEAYQTIRRGLHMQQSIKHFFNFEWKHHPVTLLITCTSLIFVVLSWILNFPWSNDTYKLGWLFFHPFFSFESLPYQVVASVFFWYLSKSLESYLGSIVLLKRLILISILSAVCFALVRGTVYSNSLFTLDFAILSALIFSRLLKRKTMPNAEYPMFILVVVLMGACLFFLPQPSIVLNIIAFFIGGMLSFSLRPYQFKIGDASVYHKIRHYFGWVTLSFFILLFIHQNYHFSFLHTLRVENTSSLQVTAESKKKSNVPTQKKLSETELIKKKQRDEQERIARQKKQLLEKQRKADERRRALQLAEQRKKEQQKKKLEDAKKLKNYLNQKIVLNEIWYDSKIGHIQIKQVYAKRNLKQKMMSLQVKIVLSAKTKSSFNVSNAQYTVYYDQLKTGLGSIKGDLTHVSSIKGKSRKTYDIHFDVPRDQKQIKLIFFNADYTKQTSIPVEF